MLAWSGGKDSAWTLHALRSAGDVQVAGLFTTVYERTGRVAVHEVRAELLDKQARAVQIRLHTVPIPWPCPNAVYERAIGDFITKTKVTHVAFGDLFLEDIRRYRERQFAGLGVELLFPLWGRPTRVLAEEMTVAGLRAWITCVDPRRAPREWAGRIFDAAFVRAVPQGIDPCGENGEFHTFVFEGPMLRWPVRARPGAPTGSDHNVCIDLRPA